MIDDGLPSEWPAEVIDALTIFQQGDIVRDPPFVYVASPRYGVWSLTRGTDDMDVEDDIFELDPEDRFPYGMIATDSCDLLEEDRSLRRHPWLSIAPVYRAGASIDSLTLEKIVDGRYAYLRSVQDAQLGSGIWIVDARILIPIEKSWLVGKDRIRVYQTPSSRDLTAAFFADRFRRPDLGSGIHTALIRPLRRWLEGLSQARYKEVLAHVKEVRLGVVGDPLDPDGAGLIIIVDAEDNRASVTTQWGRKWENWRERAEKEDIALLENSYETYDSLSARKYMESIPIDISFN